MSYLELSLNRYIKFEEPKGFINSETFHKACDQIDYYYDNYQLKFNSINYPIPEISPWDHSTFKVGKKPFDLYTTFGKIQMGFFISIRLVEFLKDFQIGDHKIFYDIVCKKKDGSRYKDLCWIAFYTDYWSYLNYKLSKFYLIKQWEPAFNEDGSDFRFEENLTFKNTLELEQYKIELRKTNFRMHCSLAFLDLPQKLDFFPLFEISDKSFFCSENFSKEFNKNKFTGAEITIPYNIQVQSQYGS